MIVLSGMPIPIATAAEMEAATAGKLVPADLAHRSPSAAKAWGRAAGNSTTVQASYNITSIADTATGVATWTWATDFSTNTYAAIVGNLTDGAARISQSAGTANAGVMEVEIYDAAGAAADPSINFIVAYGDQ